MKIKKRIGLIFLIISAVAVVILAFFLLIKIQRANTQESYYETLNTLPMVLDNLYGLHRFLGCSPNSCNTTSNRVSVRLKKASRPN